MSTDEKLDRLADVVNTLANSILAHDDQIEALTSIAEQHSTQIAAGLAADDRLRLRIEALVEVTEKQGQQIAAMERQWQAYINTLPRQ